MSEPTPLQEPFKELYSSAFNLEEYFIRLSTPEGKFLDNRNKPAQVLSTSAHREAERLKEMSWHDPHQREFGNMGYVDLVKRGMYYPEKASVGDERSVRIEVDNSPHLYPVIPIHVHPDPELFSPTDIKIVITDPLQLPRRSAMFIGEMLTTYTDRYLLLRTNETKFDTPDKSLALMKRISEYGRGKVTGLAETAFRDVPEHIKRSPHGEQVFETVRTEYIRLFTLILTNNVAKNFNLALYYHAKDGLYLPIDDRYVSDQSAWVKEKVDSTIERLVGAKT
jgi:hypothetical protein